MRVAQIDYETGKINAVIGSLETADKERPKREQDVYVEEHNNIKNLESIDIVDNYKFINGEFIEND